MKFLEILALTVERFDLVCHAFCLMGNHVHLVITTGEANLSPAIKHVMGVYGQWWNRRHERVGHVFQGRFNAQIVQDDTYLLVVCRYDALNPVRAHFVRSPSDWAWSSHRATAGLAPCPAFLAPEGLLRMLDTENLEAARRRYREFVELPLATPGQLKRDLVLGDEAFIAGFKAWRERAAREVPRLQRLERPPLGSLFTEHLSRSARDMRIVDAVAAGYSIPEVARFLGLHRCTVDRALVASRARPVAQNAEMQDLTP
jgi:REP element-mobilizing transposase RayT